MLVVPDEPWIDRHDPQPRAVELESVEQFWQAVDGTLDLDSAAGRAAWRVLVDRHGGARARWLVRTFPPLPRDAFGVIHIARPDPAQIRDQPIFSRIAGFPQRLEVWLGRGGTVPVRVAQSTVATDLLDLDLPQMNATTSPTSPNPDNPDDPASATWARWWNNWQQAQAVGLGIEVSLGTQTPDDLDVLYVVGLGEDDPARLFRAHRDSGALALLAPGSPTNAVDGAPTIDLRPAAETWGQFAQNGEKPGLGSRAVSQALTGRADALGALLGDGPAVDTRTPSALLLAALWPALWGYALKNLWGVDAEVLRAGAWAALTVCPEGPLPAICIHDQPYGLLPATSLRYWRVQPQAMFAAIEQAVQPHLLAAHKLWAEAARRAGTIQDADTDRLLQLLGHTPASPAYAHRVFASLAQMPVLFGVFTDDVAGPQDIARWWEETAQALLQLFPLRATRRYGTTGEPQDLRIPLVAPADVAPQTTLRQYLEAQSCDPAVLTGAFLPALIKEASVSGSLSTLVPASLLVRLLLHAQVVAAAEVARADAQETAPLLEEEEASTSDLTQLAQWAARMGLLEGSHVPPAGGPAVESARLAQAATAALLNLSVGVLDRALRAVLDSAAYRLDPWVTALAWARLLTQTPATHRYQLGAYGWVDAPRPREGATGGNSGSSGTGGSSGSGTAESPPAGDLLHAPSEQQALVAAILRDHALHDPEPDRWAMQLSSASIRLAERLAEEVRLGAHLQEVLGRELERLVGNRNTIDALRERFPLRSEHAGRRTCNGEAVLQAEPSDLPLNDAQRAALDPLRQALDTYGDLLVAQAAYHVVAGQGDVASSAMDAAAGLGPPPDLDLLATRRSGRGISTNVLVALPDVAPPDAGLAPGEELAIETSPALLADPAVAAFVATATGPAGGPTTPWRWPVVSADGALGEITLAQLELEPIDAALLGADDLLRLVLAQTPAGTRFAGAAPGTEAQQRAQRLLDLLGGQPAVPSEILAGGPTAADADAAVGQELRERYTRLRALAGRVLVVLEDLATDPALAAVAAEPPPSDPRALTALRCVRRWGLARGVGSGAGAGTSTGTQPQSPPGETLSALLQRAADALRARLSATPDPASSEGSLALAARQDIARALAQLAAPQGRLAILGRCVLSAQDPTTPGLTASPSLEQDWLPVVAVVRPALAALEAWQLDELLAGRPLLLQAWSNRPDDPWQTSAVLQAPTHVSRLVALYGPPGVFPADLAATPVPIACSLLDSWGETIPDETHVTTAALGYQAPAARAPQAILLAVAPTDTEALTPARLVDIVAETRELAWARMARPDDVGALATALPLLMLPSEGLTAVQLEPST